MAIDGQAFERRYALYIDFLGTRDAVASWPAVRHREFVNLLRDIKHMRGPQDIPGAPKEDGGYQITLRPAVSTFSDHVIASYPFALDEG